MPKENPNWGGYRKGSGQKPKWNTGETRPIRLPIALHEQIFQYARLLDAQKGAKIDFLCCDIQPYLETVTDSKNETVTLSNQLNTFVKTWKPKIEKGKGPRWDKARKMLEELETLLITTFNDKEGIR